MTWEPKNKTEDDDDALVSDSDDKDKDDDDKRDDIGEWRMVKYFKLWVCFLFLFFYLKQVFARRAQIFSHICQAHSCTK